MRTPWGNGSAARFGQQDLNAVPKRVDLLRLAAGPERPQLAAAHHSENTAAFPGRQDGPIKGMRSRDSAAVPQFGPLMTFPIRHDFLRLSVTCRTLVSGQHATVCRPETPMRTPSRIAPCAVHSFVTFDAEGAAAGEAAAEAFFKYFAIGMS
jgi:hypothetical protein